MAWYSPEDSDPCVVPVAYKYVVIFIGIQSLVPMLMFAVVLPLVSRGASRLSNADGREERSSVLTEGMPGFGFSVTGAGQSCAILEWNEA